MADNADLETAVAISGPPYGKDVLKMTFLISGTIWIHNFIKFVVSYPLFTICVVA